MGAFGGRRRGGGGRRKKKKKKAPKNNWFERLTQVELKQLLAAAQLPPGPCAARQLKLPNSLTGGDPCDGYDLSNHETWRAT